MIVCCSLAWWQWQRFSSAGGSFLNLGYVLQWPLFGLFPAFMFWRLRKLRQQAAAEAETRAGTAGETGADGATAGNTRPPAAGLPQPRPSHQVTRQQAPPVDDEDEDDAELAAYNRYLAELNASQARSDR